MKKPKFKLLKEFKDFINRGNVVDLAIGVIIGGAFSAIVTALTNQILMPIINYILNLITGGKGLEGVYSYLHTAYMTNEAGEKVIDIANSIYIDWGAFITAIINFLLIALVLFLIVKAINTLRDGASSAKKKYYPLTKEEYKALRKEGKSRNEILAVAVDKKATQEAEATAAAEKAAAEAAAEAAKPSPELELLTEIRDLLKQQALKNSESSIPTDED